LRDQEKLLYSYHDVVSTFSIFIIHMFFVSAFLIMPISVEYNTSILNKYF